MGYGIFGRRYESQGQSIPLTNYTPSSMILNTLVVTNSGAESRNLGTTMSTPTELSISTLSQTSPSQTGSETSFVQRATQSSELSSQTTSTASSFSTLGTSLSQTETEASSSQQVTLSFEVSPQTTSTASSLSTSLGLSTSAQTVETTTGTSNSNQNGGILQLDLVIYGEEYFVSQGGVEIATFTFSGGQRSFDPLNQNTLTVQFNTGFYPEDGESITLFEFAEGGFPNLVVEGLDDCFIAESTTVSSGNIERYQLLFSETACSTTAGELGQVFIGANFLN